MSLDLSEGSVGRSLASSICLLSSCKLSSNLPSDGLKLSIGSLILILVMLLGSLDFSQIAGLHILECHIGVMLGYLICTSSSSLGIISIVDLSAISGNFFLAFMAFWYGIS